MSKQSGFTVEENLSAARGTEWREYTAGTSGGAVASHAAATGIIHKICGVTVHTDKDSTVQIKSSTTVIWEVALDVSAEGFAHHFTFPEPLQGAAGELVSVTVASSTTDSGATIWGFSEKAV